MNVSQSTIVELFDRLSAAARQELAEHLYQRASPDFVSAMSTAQRADLDTGLAEADRGEGDAEDVVFRRLEQKFGVKL
jgi:predicted transcriptional regulator